MEVYVAYLALGATAGIVAGMLGVGGGLIIVPVLVSIFQFHDFPALLIVHMAIGTSLATIIFTSLSSIYAHHFRHHAIDWSIVKQFTPGIVVGAFIGAMIADYLKATVLQRFFGLFELYVAIQMAFNLKAKAHSSLPGSKGMFFAGTGIGTLSSIVGIGGGTLTVPFLSWCHVRMQKAVAISSACGLPIAIAGATGYILTGLNEVNLPAYTTGYLYWPALLLIVIASVLFAPLGAKLAHKLPAVQLRRVFSVVLFVLAMKMLLD